jgi:hypothetical protein
MIIFNKTPKELFQMVERHETKIVWFGLGLLIGLIL